MTGFVEFIYWAIFAVVLICQYNLFIPQEFVVTAE
jgi:hypothetical protein